MRQEIPFNGAHQEGRLGLVGAQQSINLYPKVQNPGDKNKISLYSTPGLKLLVSAGAGPCRSNGALFAGKIYFVSGANLISINSVGATASVGVLNSSGSRVSIVGGRDYIALVDGTDGYTYNGTTFAVIADANFPASPTHITYLDGFFIVNKGSSDEFYISAVEDPTSWAALDFAVAEASPDDILALASSEKDLYLAGSTTTQVYYNSGNADFPFDPYPNGVIQMGIEAANSMVSSAHGVHWLGRSEEGELRVMNARGLQATVVSTSDIDWQISQFADATDAIAWVEQDGDRAIYVLTFPSADRTFCYDVLLPPEIGWFEKKTWQIGRWRAAGYGALGSQRIIGDYENSKFYTLDFNTFDEDGVTLERKRVSQIVHSDKKELTFYELVLDLEVGVGLTLGQGVDPQIMLRFSHDGGKTWSSELWEDLGKIGERNIEVYWSKLGEGRTWMFEVKVTDPVEVNIIAAFADIEVSSW